MLALLLPLLLLTPADTSCNVRLDDCEGFRPSEKVSVPAPTNTCFLPAQAKLTTQPVPCGNGGIARQDCLKAGCCYDNTSQCFKPRQAEISHYRWYKTPEKYKEAIKICRKAGEGLYKVACAHTPEQYSQIADKMCGNTWSTGSIMKYNVQNDDIKHDQQLYYNRNSTRGYPSFKLYEPANRVTFYNTTSNTCQPEKQPVSCVLSSPDGALSLHPGEGENEFYLSLGPKNQRKPFLCLKEEWKPHLASYPYHVFQEALYHNMICGIRFSGNVTEKRLKGFWSFEYPNGTMENRESYKFVHNTIAQYYVITIKADEPGRYTCSYRYLDDDGLQTEHEGSAYHYTRPSCHILVNGLRVSGAAALVPYNTQVNVTLDCTGYPKPKFWPIVKINDKFPMSELSELLTDDVFTIKNFAVEEPLQSDYTYLLTLYPQPFDISLEPLLDPMTLTLSKLPQPTTCLVKFIRGGNEESHSLGEGVVDREVERGTGYRLVFQCTGYPKPKMTTSMTTQTPQHTTTVQLIESSDDATHFEWEFEGFADEVPMSDDYTLSYTLSEPNTPIPLTLTLTKTPSPPGCDVTMTSRYLLSGVRTEGLSGVTMERLSGVTEEVWDGVELYVARKFFPQQSINVTVNCTGYPAPDLTVSTLEPGERVKTMTTGSHVTLKEPSFAHAVPAPEEHLVTHHITSTTFHLNITILLHKTMVQLDDTCNTVLPSRLECLGCKGISAVPYPSPTAFWVYDRAPLDVEQFEDHLTYQDPRNRERDATIYLNKSSSIVTGTYTCVINNGVQLRLERDVVTDRRPVAPGPAFIVSVERVKAYVRVTAASSWQPSYSSAEVSFVAKLFSKDKEVFQAAGTVEEDRLVTATFNLTSDIKVIQVGFTASNKFGTSELSVPSEKLELLPGIPGRSVSSITRDKKRSLPSTLSSTLALTFPPLPSPVAGYSLRIYSAGVLVREELVESNAVQAKGLRPDREYLVNVRGFNLLKEGDRIYGPSSLNETFLTYPQGNPPGPQPPENFGAQAIKSGNESAAMLTWSPPTKGIEFVSGYNLTYRPQEEETSRRRRQALQSVSLLIPLGARAKIVKGLESGTRYQFVMKSYSDDFGESLPATVTVQTLSAGPCPFTRPQLYPPSTCRPRVDVLSSWMFIKLPFDCYEGEGMNYTRTNEDSSTVNGMKCVPWSHDLLKQFQHLDNLPEIGSLGCRNFPGSWKDSKEFHSSPWCYIEDGKNETCAIRSCDSNIDVDCYTGNGEGFKGSVVMDDCTKWTKGSLEEHNITDYDETDLGTISCRNWPGSNVETPWCFSKEGVKITCGIPPCGHVSVSLTLGSTQKSYQVKPESNSLCINVSGHDSVEVSVKHSYGVADCESNDVVPEVVLPKKRRLLDKLWVRYLLLQGAMFMIVAGLWVSLLYRKQHVYLQEQSSKGTYRKTGSSRLEET